MAQNLKQTFPLPPQGKTFSIGDVLATYLRIELPGSNLDNIAAVLSFLTNRSITTDNIADISHEASQILPLQAAFLKEVRKDEFFHALNSIENETEKDAYIRHWLSIQQRQFGRSFTLYPFSRKQKEKMRLPDNVIQFRR